VPFGSSRTSIRRSKGQGHRRRHPQAAVKNADTLKQDARALADAVGGGGPASSDATALRALAAKLRSASSSWPLSPQAQTSWRSLEGGLEKVAQAFQLPLR
jgi:hypothetical protein